MDTALKLRVDCITDGHSSQTKVEWDKVLVVALHTLSALQLCMMCRRMEGVVC